MYICNDCFDVLTYMEENPGVIPGICYPCMNTCHSGHELIDCGVQSEFFCDCGLPCCKKKCGISWFYCVLIMEK